MDYVKKYQLLRLLFFIIPSAGTRTKLLRKTNYFYSMGKNIHFQPRHLPADPKFIKLHNNICIASGVTFITHDILHMMLNRLPSPVAHDIEFQSHLGCIEIMDNVFVGANVIVLPNVKIGENSIIGAGSIVTKDVPPYTVVAGVPAKKVGSFNDVIEKRRVESRLINTKNRLERVESEWELFYRERKDYKI